MKKLTVLIIGKTASGKTRLGHKLASVAIKLGMSASLVDEGITGIFPKKDTDTHVEIHTKLADSVLQGSVWTDEPKYEVYASDGIWVARCSDIEETMVGATPAGALVALTDWRATLEARKQEARKYLDKLNALNPDDDADFADNWDIIENGATGALKKLDVDITDPESYRDFAAWLGRIAATGKP